MRADLEDDFGDAALGVSLLPLLDEVGVLGNTRLIEIDGDAVLAQGVVPRMGFRSVMQKSNAMGAGTVVAMSEAICHVMF